jgi:hypothetical protein
MSGTNKTHSKKYRSLIKKSILLQRAAEIGSLPLIKKMCESVSKDNASRTILYSSAIIETARKNHLDCFDYILLFCKANEITKELGFLSYFVNAEAWLASNWAMENGVIKNYVEYYNNRESIDIKFRREKYDIWEKIGVDND